MLSGIFTFKRYSALILGLTLLLSVKIGLAAEPYLDIARDGRVFTLKAYIDVERSADQVWPYLWEFRHMSSYIDDVYRIDSIAGGENWYMVRLVGNFPFVHAEVTNRKWIIEEGRHIGAKATECQLETFLPLKLISSDGYWRIEPLGNSRSRIHYQTVVEVYAAGFEALYTPIAKRDGKRIMKSFKRYVESR